MKLEKPWNAMPIHQQIAEEAFNLVLENAGAALPKTDKVNTRIVNETKGGFATYEGATYRQKQTLSDPTKKSGIIDTQNDVGGWPELISLPAPKNSDQDGIPDEWEKAINLDPQDPEDRILLQE
ncbi:hypothetical protein [Cyclobacterium sp.]|uniref:hypothetical protein n=1 Tax=Cyclobacterium sp. TaxID=1966343 RepID=UPI0025C3930B|nr:hypothetical protein [Cyclobacterium sp.]